MLTGICSDMIPDRSLFPVSSLLRSWFRLPAAGLACHPFRPAGYDLTAVISGFSGLRCEAAVISALLGP